MLPSGKRLTYANRTGWASVSDDLGRENVFNLFFAVQLVAFPLLPQTSNPLLFQVPLLTVPTMYRGGFASLPAFIGDLFAGLLLLALATSLAMAANLRSIRQRNARTGTGGSSVEA